MTNTINFTRETASEFRAAYKKAIAENQDQFVFQGHEVLVSYAKYLCEYLTNQGVSDEDQTRAL